MSTQPLLEESFKITLVKISNENSKIQIFEPCNSKKLNYLERCSRGKKFNYTDLLSTSTFCLVLNQHHSFKHSMYIKEMTLFDTLKFNCIPVVVSDEWILPFSEFLDWTLFSVQLRSFQINDIVRVLEDYSESDIKMMKKQAEYVFIEYFASMGKITLGVLKYLESRISRNYKNMEFSYNQEVKFRLKFNKIDSVLLKPLTNHTIKKIKF